MIDRNAFFGAARACLFGGTMAAGQIAGITAILDEWDLRKLTDDRWLAYMLATGFWETDKAMQPVREAYYMGEPAAEAYRKTLRYYPFYGRGLPQLTWEDNYRTMTAHAQVGKRFNVDLVKNPDAALIPAVAIAIMFEGMLGGVFTGVSLATYFNASTDDPVNGRRIINGTDHDAEIADIHRGFLAALRGTPYVRVLKIGCVGDDVKAVQTALRLNMVDGIFGSGTRRAVMNFQLGHGLDADGAVGNDTRTALGL